MARPSAGGKPRIERDGLGARVRRIALALAWSVGLFAGLGVTGAPAGAQDRAPLTPAAITAFEQKLQGARATQADIAARVACFETQKRQMIGQRDTDQLRLGQLVQHRRELAPLLISQEAEYRAFEATRNAEQSRMDLLRNELADLERRKRSQEHALANCKAEPWTINALCDLAYGLAHLTGRFVDNQQQINDTQRRLDSAIQATAAAEGRYRTSKSAYDANEADAAATTTQITIAETSIGRLQAALSALETNRHDSKELLDAFDQALDNAKELDTADGQASTARLVRSLAVRVDEAAQRSDGLFKQAKATLTEQQLRSCI
jgi:chromosome segregation ATPase